MAGGHHGSGKERGKRPPIDHGQLLDLIGRLGEEKKEGEEAGAGRILRRAAAAGADAGKKKGRRG
jgi:hypothetical protein